MSPGFVHLRIHSEFSLRDSIIRLPEKSEYVDPAKAPTPNLLSRALEHGHPALALTDDSNLFGLVKFYRAAEGAGVKPIAGADVWFAEGEEAPSRMTLLCRDRDGYLSLSRLLSRAYLEGHRGDCVVARPQWLFDDGAGLFVLAGRESMVGADAAAGKIELAERTLDPWLRHFDERLYLALTRTGRDGEEAFNAAALELAARRDLPLLATNDVRFIAREDFDAHEARVCISTGRVLDDPRRPRDTSPEQYLKSAAEMAELFADLPEALENTVELAKRCNIELSFGTYYLPQFPVPDDETLETWIRKQAHEGLDARLARQPLAPGHDRASYEARLDIELDVIIKMGFPGYFLIVADFINWGKHNGIPVGPGRGSGAGSLVAWALGITDLDPLPYDLLFERFLNPERVSMPDFDIDFCMDRRDEVIDYVARKYGRDRVSQIITYGTMAAKAVVRDCGRVLGHPYGFVDGIAKLIPNTLGITLSDALGRTKKAQADPELSSAELMQRYETEEEVRDLIDLALKLEDLTRNAGKHAGGVVIAPSPLTDFAPLFAEQAAKGETAKSIVTQYDKDDVESVGLVKFDFLGLRTLTIIDWAVKAINARHAREGRPALDITALKLDDREAYRIFAAGDTVAVFQFESRGMRELLKRAKPDVFEDIIALAALFRPGPLGSGMDRDWVDRKHGNAEVTYPHPSLEPVLKPTYGVIVYQEQVMQIAQVLAGYSLGGADLLRRAMGKKKPEEMAKQRQMFEAGAAERGVDPQTATSIFDLMEKFAEYGFNKSHSAAYALVAYQTAWLKAHYPAEFMAAVMSSDMDNTEKVTGFLEEARAMGLTVLSPDVNASTWMFEATDPKTIRYGLGAIKGVGQGAIEAVVAARESGGPFTDLLTFCRRVEAGRLNRRVLEAMVLSGALDGLGENRATLMLQLPEVMRATEQMAREREAGQVSLFGGASDDAAPALHLDLPRVDEWPLKQRLDGERDTLGHYRSGHPLDPYRPELASLTGRSLGELAQMLGDTRGRREVQVKVAGVVTAVRRKGETQAFVQIEDGHGRLECAFFGEAFGQYAPLLGRDRVLILDGGLREDEFSGGYALRVRGCWEFDQVCAQNGRRLQLTLDVRGDGALDRFESALAPYRPGRVPMRLQLVTRGSRGVLDLNGSHSIRPSAELLGHLRALPFVSNVALALGRPWAD
ncbi:DNA polymerase III subunit alpha [Coralloluteibacterium stylophorae]|uniref:DNA polymerase III subunit alpha n=1 Tax=Coralloluteibacterium stylophorae TaxID=1776034 RepID=A0A8J7VX72_9GAMM|nr:DNA polymerase III subunit alpha [Coralloluteibacterium stylophorae]MBS7456339.1 DNA polymerase III subunit alpha [Coralloluteibacterium stylophorae]